MPFIIYNIYLICIQYCCLRKTDQTIFYAELLYHKYGLFILILTGASVLYWLCEHSMNKGFRPGWISREVF